MKGMKNRTRVKSRSGKLGLILAAAPVVSARDDVVIQL